MRICPECGGNGSREVLRPQRDDPYYAASEQCCCCCGVGYVEEDGPPESCPYCLPGTYTGLPGNACENCMNTRLKYPERTA